MASLRVTRSLSHAVIVHRPCVNLLVGRSPVKSGCWLNGVQVDPNDANSPSKYTRVFDVFLDRTLLTSEVDRPLRFLHARFNRHLLCQGFLVCTQCFLGIADI